MTDLELAEEIQAQQEQFGSPDLTGAQWDQIVIALRRGPDDIVNLKNKAQVMHDLHDALGVKWGCDPYAEIRRLKGIEKLCDELLAQRPPSGEMVMVPRDAWEGFVRMLQKHQGHKDRGDITPQRILELARAMLSAAEAEGRKS